MTDEELYAWIDTIGQDDPTHTPEEWEKLRQGIKRIHEVHYGDEGMLGTMEELMAFTEMHMVKALASKGITQKNWLQHLDELTDREITAMLNQEPGRAGLDEERKAQPDISDRTRAEHLRDF